MVYEDLQPDRAYRVTSGDNGTLYAGDVIWVDSVRGSLCVAGGQGGWLDRDEIGEDVFEGVEIEEAPEFTVRTSANGATRLERA